MAYVGTVSQHGSLLNTFAGTLQGEAAGQGTLGMQAVAGVVLNRAAAGGFGNGVMGVLTSPNQFQGWATPGPQALSVAQSALGGSLNNPVPGALYYANPSASSAQWALNLNSGNSYQIGSHFFTDNTQGNPYDPNASGLGGNTILTSGSFSDFSGTGSASITAMTPEQMAQFNNGIAPNGVDQSGQFPTDTNGNATDFMGNPINAGTAPGSDSSATGSGGGLMDQFSQAFGGQGVSQLGQGQLGQAAKGSQVPITGNVETAAGTVSKATEKAAQEQSKAIGTLDTTITGAVSGLTTTASNLGSGWFSNLTDLFTRSMLGFLGLVLIAGAVFYFVQRRQAMPSLV